MPCGKESKKINMQLLKVVIFGVGTANDLIFIYMYVQSFYNKNIFFLIKKFN